MENNGHWRNLTDMEHLRAECFFPKERKVLTIKDVKSEKVNDGKGNTESKPVAYFEEEGILPLVLNVTNCKTIEKLYKTGITSEWVGKKIQIFATKTKVGGEMVPCIRIENVVPTSDEVQYHCCVCGKIITKETYDKSVKHFQKPYCSKECLDKDTNETNNLLD